MDRSITAIAVSGASRVQAVILTGIIAVYLTLSLTYGWVNPVFEAPDELWHYLYVDQIHKTGTLPVQAFENREIGPRQEASQPPLYYLLAAVVSWPIEADDLPAYEQLNFRHRMGDSFAPDQRNLIYHTEKEKNLTSGTARSAHLIRILSSLLGAITVLATYCIVRMVMPGSPVNALAASALVAFLPQFVFISSAINNDNLAIAASTICLWLLLRIRERRSTGLVILLGVALAVAALSKLSAIALLPALAFGMLWQPRAKCPLLPRIADLAIVGGIAVLLAGWWYARNLLLYGEPLGLSAMLAVAGTRETVPSIEQVARELWLIKDSFWAFFGWTDVPADPWFYSITDAITGLGLLGWLVQLYRKSSHGQIPHRGLLLAWVAMTVISFANWNRLTPASQGRLLLTALPPLAALFVWGLRPFEIRGLNVAMVATPILLAAMSAYALPAYLLPSYNTLPILSRANVGPISERQIDFASYRLVGYRLPNETFHPGDKTTVSLFWQRRADSSPLTRFLHVERPGEKILAGGDSAIGGDLPWPVWRGEDVLRDDVEITIAENIDAPLVADVTLGLYDQRMEGINGVDGGTLLSGPAVLAKIRIVPSRPLGAPNSGQQAVYFGGQVALVGSELPRLSWRTGGVLEGRLLWQGITAPTADYTVFVHLVKEEAPVSQYDSQPRGGRYPTSAWRPGELIPDRFSIPLAGVAPGRYRLLMGLYEPKSGVRVQTPAGTAVDLGQVTIAP